MNQEKIGNFIKEIRKKNGLTQQQFASKYGVTYQAVSKWETGKNIPDITILKEICNDYNIDINDLLEGNKSNKKSVNKIIILISIVVAILIAITCLTLYLNNKPSDFDFKALSTNCEDFNLFGSIAYSDSKTSIYISNITYCGDNDDTKYKKIECILYETDGDIKRKIDSYNYDEDLISLDEFLSKVKFNIEHYSKTCNMYKENALHLEIEATSIDGKIKYYKIPLNLQENCD